jgi:hypothetical protein
MEKEDLKLDIGQYWKATQTCKVTFTRGAVYLLKTSGLEFRVPLNEEMTLNEGDEISCSEYTEGKCIIT